MPERPLNEFQLKATGRQQGVATPFLHLALHNMKWWLTPILVLLLLASVLIILGGSGIARFIYSIS